jgi:hypothetical protein
MLREPVDLIYFGSGLGPLAALAKILMKRWNLQNTREFLTSRVAFSLILVRRTVLCIKHITSNVGL